MGGSREKNPLENANAGQFELDRGGGNIFMDVREKSRRGLKLADEKTAFDIWGATQLITQQMIDEYNLNARANQERIQRLGEARKGQVASVLGSPGRSSTILTRDTELARPRGGLLS